MTHYILQTIAFQLLFLVVYDLFLKKETFFNVNRAYLLLTPVLSLVIPFIQISAIRESIPEQYMMQLPAVVIGEASMETTAWSSLLRWQSLWILGALLSVSFFGYKLFRIYKLKRTGSISKFQKFSIVVLPGTTAAFSFFRNIFLGADLSEAQQQSILLHEKVHVSEKHTWDLLFFEVLRVLFWFNPLVYLYQKRMTTLQEYIADRHVAAQKTTADYYQDLLSQVFQTEKISFINTFFNRSLIKNRIFMLQKSNSRKIFQLKYLLLVPVVFGMLLYTSCVDESTAQNTEAEMAEAEKTEVMQRIVDLSEAIMKKGNLTPEEDKALTFLATPAEPGDKIYTSVDEYLQDSKDVPFAVIDKVPLFPGCEGLSKEDAKKCTTQGISNHVSKNFNTKLAKQLGLSGKQRVVAQFKITKQGTISKVNARAGYPELEEEAVRVIKSLPKMIPGESKGKKVGVIYSIPILFKVSE
ncbi:MAG: M56 family metallopeptidase [Bacteroidota bacterium]